MNLYINNKTVLEYKDNLFNFLKSYHANNNPATYTSPDCELKSLQCRTGVNRGFQDIVCLCQTYFPGITPTDVAKVWRRLYESTPLEVMYCYDINKVVAYNNGNPHCWEKHLLLGQKKL